MTSDSPKKDFAGKLAEKFVHSKLTLVFVILSLLMGVLAVFLTPKEEEPQISVPMIDISIGAPGLNAKEIEEKLTEPVERAVWGLEGVEYVYSTSGPNGMLVTVRFRVGEPLEPSLVKVHHKVMEIRSSLPKNISDPLVKSYSIDDVPFLTLTYSSKKLNDYEIRKTVASLAKELSSIPDLSSVNLLGGSRRAIRVIADPEKMKARGISLVQLAEALRSNFALYPAGKTWGADAMFDIEVGGRPSSATDVGNISVGQRGGMVVRLSDVADVIDGPEQQRRLSVFFDKDTGSNPVPAVSLSFSKRKGTNVVVLAKNVLTQAERFQKKRSDDIQLTVTRNYGETAQAKSHELIEHLLIATLSVAVLIALFMGVRAALVVVIAVPVTLALTLAIYYFLGYTLNRVTLFALIFSIGILVDDAIVVVENIERHLSMKTERGIIRATLDAVSEVGNPTILATFTVIAAILPMAFVRGLMGPYMKPIPVGASLAMILSLIVAFVVTPWAAIRILKSTHHKDTSENQKMGLLDRIYVKIMNGLLLSRLKALQFGVVALILFSLAASLVYFKAVKVKMLPFDNKNEFQVLVDYPTQTSLQQTKIFSEELAAQILKTPEVKQVQIYIGEAAPFSFSGMVKHVFLRGRDDQADLQIVLSDKSDRNRSSHEIITALRPVLSQFGESHQALTKILEIPPGPPVLATMLAEIYGPSDEAREKTAMELYKIMKSEPSVVDLDTSLRPSRSLVLYGFDYAQAGVNGVRADIFAANGSLTFSETPLGLLADDDYPEDVFVDLSLKSAARLSGHPFSDLVLPSFESGVIQMDQVAKPAQILPVVYRQRKNLKPVVYVMSELSGAEEAPVYGMLKLAPQIQVPQQTALVPEDTSSPVLKWDGEWFITYEVFRDLGFAFAVVMVLIYILVLGWFKSFKIPFVIMAPIPISLIGILPGHALTGVYFTATSMIGFIAGAGIIVRNSIILVDFIEHQLQTLGHTDLDSVRDAVIKAGVLRFRPMLLTAAAVVVGSSVMLFDPIFQGLAVSLIFGEVAATLISRFAVPVMYFWFIKRKN